MTQPLKNSPGVEAAAWKSQFAANMHLQVRNSLRCCTAHARDYLEAELQG